jgi:exopolyphosphatase / guanosine-5'-triphosphate,3'-diphosphate pyrophosphatase
VSGSTGRLAAIDVGSNTILLTVAEPDAEKGLRIVQEAEDQPRLGAGLGTTGRLQEDAMQRALQTLIQMRDTCLRLNAHRIGAVATAAVRDAMNGNEFVQRVRAVDVPLQVISPEIEAALSYRSAAYRFGSPGRMLVADIGGGSLELIGAASGTLGTTLSLPLGAVRLTELRMSKENLRRHVQKTLAATFSADQWRAAMVIGSGGTFATLASMTLARRGEARDGVHGTSIGRDEVQQLLETLAGMSLEERRKVPGLRPQRADIIVAGVTVVAQLLNVVRTDRVTVSGFGLRDGLLLDMLELPTPRTGSRCS